MEQEQIYSLAVSAFCSIMLGSTIVNARKDFSLAGIGGDLTEEVRTRFTQKMFSVDKAGWALPEEGLSEPVEASAKLVQIVIIDNSLSTIAKKVWNNEEAVLIDVTDAAKLLKLVSDDQKYDVKQVIEPLPFEKKILNVNVSNNGKTVDIILVRKTNLEINMYLAREDGKRVKRAVQITRQSRRYISEEEIEKNEEVQRGFEAEKYFWLRRYGNTAVSSLSTERSAS
ncbi:MAG: hypothetical protein A3J74_07565 [Elusimicrobia bacterium RIFCSPHIGHO2_02_FULL_57_9]|nr:MAG: hypothetical protein A3J74_07565 [Elusimicrobia bacterium RIFCSPHIGHO2_02_FULL_57_9]